MKPEPRALTPQEEFEMSKDHDEHEFRLSKQDLLWKTAKLWLSGDISTDHYKETTIELLRMKFDETS
jgi:hypothetical protein